MTLKKCVGGGERTGCAGQAVCRISPETPLDRGMFDRGISAEYVCVVSKSLKLETSNLKRCLHRNPLISRICPLNDFFRAEPVVDENVSFQPGTKPGPFVPFVAFCSNPNSTAATRYVPAGYRGFPPFLAQNDIGFPPGSACIPAGSDFSRLFFVFFYFGNSDSTEGNEGNEDRATA